MPMTRRAALQRGERYLPDGMPDTDFYRPVERGLEIRIAEKLRDLKDRNQKKN